MPGMGASTQHCIESVAPKYGLPVPLVAAIVHVESSGDQYAWNPEPPYRYLWDVRANRPFRKLTPVEIASEIPPRDFGSAAGAADAEWWGQQASWGLMQVMGAVAREIGFKGHFPGLSHPLENLHVGCAHLRNLRRRFEREHGMPGVVAAYNAGSPRLSGGVFENQVYVDKVIRAGGLR